MSFYGSIYYQLVDAIYKIIVKNKGQNTITFPAEDIIADEEVYRAPGRQGIFSLDAGNRWLLFTKDNFKMDDKGEYVLDSNGEKILVEDNENPFTIWHNAPDVENCAPIHGLKKVENMYYAAADNFDLDEIVDRVIPAGGLVEGARLVIDVTEKIENDNGEEEEVVTQKVYEYKLNDNQLLQWENITDIMDPITILTPDDFFLTTESGTVDAAGHITAAAPHYYKMPKSDVQEQIDLLWGEVEDIKEVNEDQQESIDIHDEYVGDWSKNRGYILKSDLEGVNWVPTLSSTIGNMDELFGVAPSDNGSLSGYYANQDANLVKILGNLKTLYDDLYLDTNFPKSETATILDVNFVKVLLYLKNKLIAANATAIEANRVAITNAQLAMEGLDLRLDAIEGEALPRLAQAEEDILAINDPQTGILITAKNYTDSLANGAVKVNTEAITAINHPDTGILANAKSYTDNLANGAVKDNTNNIAAINHAETGILANANKYTDSLANGAVKANTDAITAIHHSETGILANANKYTDELANGAVKDNADAITAINNSETGILKTANNYTDAEIDKLNYTDSAAADGQYVYSVNETNGIIAVEHKTLPTYTLTSGKSDGTVAFNGDDVIVSGLKSAAYSSADAFDPAGAAVSAKNEAISAAKTETENQVKALAESTVADNTAAIEALELLLQDYSDLVAKVADLEQRIIALETPPSDPEPEPEPEPEPDPALPENGEDPEIS